MDEVMEEPLEAVGEAEGWKAERAALLAERAALLAECIEQARARPGVVPELVGGNSLEELRASLEVAGAAFRRIAARPGQVGAGGGTRQAGGERETPPPGQDAALWYVLQGLERR